MGKDTQISWADHTFNVVHGCARVSPGCLNCYADTLSRRWGKALWGKDAPRQVMSDAYWRLPLSWERESAKSGLRRRVFCGSMCDWAEAHETTRAQVPRLWELIRATPHLDWLLLTKRPEEIAGLLPDDWGAGYGNVWLGTSVEDQKRANKRIPHLLRVPSVLRFLSIEPMLGRIDLNDIRIGESFGHSSFDCLFCEVDKADDDEYGGRSINWVICGGESGSGFRSMQLSWADQLYGQCAVAKVPFWFKQVAALRPGQGEDALGRVVQELPVVDHEIHGTHERVGG